MRNFPKQLLKFFIILFHSSIPSPCSPRLFFFLPFLNFTEKRFLLLASRRTRRRQRLHHRLAKRFAKSFSLQHNGRLSDQKGWTTITIEGNHHRRCIRDSPELQQNAISAICLSVCT
jgi:hypothetical protein